MSLDGSWIPQTKTEDRLMEDISIAIGRAHSDGAERERIAALLAFMASATLDPASASEAEEDPESMEEAFERARERGQELERPEECPECGTPIERVVAQMGGPYTVIPCDCTVPVENGEAVLGEWVTEI